MKLRIDKAIYGGSGLARIPESEGPLAGKAIFVPLALPGELVEAHAVADKRSFVEGELDAVIETAPGRVAPGCPYFPVCGGCQYQHADYRTQTKMKLAVLRETLARARVAAPEEIGLLAGEAWRYRNRIRLHVCYAPEFMLCYRERRSNRDLPVEVCPIAAPLLERGLRAVEQVGRQLQLPPGLLDQAEFFCDAAETTLVLSLWSGRPEKAAARLQEIAAAVMRELPECRGVALFAVSERAGGRERREVSAESTATVRGAMLASAGETTMSYPVGDLHYHVSAGSFFQINRFLLPEMLSLVAGGRTGELAWDLYAGVGLFAHALSQSFRQVVAVEGSPSSGTDLRQNLSERGHRIVASSTMQFLQTEIRRRSFASPELVVVDPPRSGLGKPTCDLLAQVKSREIVYVSCDPATLARDLQALLLSGYRLNRMTLVDLFPQTFHLETVAELVR